MSNRVPVLLRAAYNYDVDEASRACALVCVGPSRTKQSFAEEADINHIVKVFGITGQLPQIDHVPSYETFEDVFDFHSAMNAVAAARESFDALPAEVRRTFQNDPQEFVVFCSNPDNRDQLKKWGFIDEDRSAVRAGEVGIPPAVGAGGGPGVVPPVAGRSDVPRGNAGDSSSAVPGVGAPAGIGQAKS